MEDFTFFESIESVHQQLRTISENNEILDHIRRCLLSWDYKATYPVNKFKEDIPQVIEELIHLLFENTNGDTSHVTNLISEFVHFEIYDTVFFRIKETLRKDDLAVYNISKYFCKNNVTPKQLGATFYNFVPNAAVVELSMLNNKRTALSKIKCLQSAYDYIFAEVKGALISVISKYSEKEIDLPFINNKEVVPIVISVILKSKLFYFISDMSYIREFGSEILSANTNLREIYGVFEESIHKILNLKSITDLELTNETLQDKLSVCDAINFIETLSQDNQGSQSVFNEERNRVAGLITSATTEDLAKYT